MKFVFDPNFIVFCVLLIIIIGSLISGMTGYYTMIQRSKNPISYWFMVAIYIFFGILFLLKSFKQLH